MSKRVFQIVALGARKGLLLSKTGIYRPAIGTSTASSCEHVREHIAKSLAERGYKLIGHNELCRAPGFPTGWQRLDEFLASGGFPCGEISLLESSEGLGATTLWLDTARSIQQKGQLVAWVQSPISPILNPSSAVQRGLDLRKLLFVETPAHPDGLKKRLWILQELLATRLFSFVGCDLGDVPLPLREGRSLLAQARRSGAAVVLIARSADHARYANAIATLRTLTSVALEFQSNHCRILRAPHRPVPQTLARRNRHVEFLSGRHSLKYALELSLSLSLSPSLGPGPSSRTDV